MRRSRHNWLRIAHAELAASLALVVAAGAFAASCSSKDESGGAGGKLGSGGAGARGGAGGKGITGGTAGSGFGGFNGSGTGGASASGGTGGFGASGGSSGTNGVGGSGGSGGSGGTPKDSGPLDAPFVYDAPVATPDACASETRRAEQIPLDIYVMYDQSTSMTCLIDPNNLASPSRWNVVTPAFQSFLSSPQANGIGVGIQYFGQGGDCNSQLYFNPDVQIAPLPGNRTALQNSLQAHAMIGINLTTTNAALIGAVDQAKARKNANPTHAVVVLLVTDGQPNACGVVGDVVNTARAGVTGNPSIRTFVLGIVAGSGGCGFDPNPPNVPDLNSVAAAGGTQQAYIVDAAAGNATQLLLNALDQIRGSAALPCQYLIPKPSGGLPDLTKIEVTFTRGGGQPQRLPKVANSGACTAAGGGWYFDNNANPTAIILCPSTCSAASADINASVDVTVGCIRG